MKKTTTLLFIFFSLTSFSQDIGESEGKKEKPKISQESSDSSPKYEVKSEGGFVNGDISAANDELNKALWVEEKFAGESRTCNFKEKTADFRIFDLGTKIGDDCYKAVDSHHAELQKMLKEKHSDSKNQQTSSLQYQAESDVVQMKMTKAKERCGQVLALNIQYAGARANFVYNLGVVSERKKCRAAWVRLSEKRGNCGGNQRKTLSKFDEVYKKFDPVKSSGKVGQFVDFIEELSKQNNGCSGATLKKKEYHCGLFTKRLRKGHVICEYRNPSDRKRTSLLEDKDLNLYYFADSLANAISDLFISKAMAGSMWDELKSLSDSVSTGLVDNDQRLAPYIYDPMVRGVTYQSIISKKEETAGTYDKIVLENYGRSNLVGDIKDELNGVTEQASGSILDGVLNIDPSNPTALTDTNLEALDKLSIAMNKCTYGELPDGACKQSHLKWNEFYGEGENNHILTEIFDPQLNAFRASAMSELSKGRIFSKKMNAAMNGMAKSNKKIKDSKKSPSLSSYKKLASIGGMNLGEKNFMDATNRSWPQVKKALASNGNFQNLLGSLSNSKKEVGKKDQEQKGKNGVQVISETKSGDIQNSGLKQNANGGGQFKFEWNDDPNVSDEYHKKMEAEVERLVQNGEMPKNAGIDTNKSRNIFNIISRRYLITGYKALQLEEIDD